MQVSAVTSSVARQNASSGKEAAAGGERAGRAVTSAQPARVSGAVADTNLSAAKASKVKAAKLLAARALVAQQAAAHASRSAAAGPSLRTRITGIGDTIDTKL